MYTRSYGSRPTSSPRTLPPDYGGTALVIPQPEAPHVTVTPTEVPPEKPPHQEPPSSPPSRRSRFTGRRRPIVAEPSQPPSPDYDARRDTEREPPLATRRNPLGAPPFGGGGQPFPTDAACETVIDEEALTPARGEPALSPLSLQQDDLLLLGLLLFLLHEQDEEGTDCRDALLLLAVLFVAGL